MDLCITLQTKVLALETTKTTQALEIESLKRRVKKLEKKQRSRTHKLKRLYKVGSTRRVESSDDEGLGAQEDASKQGRKIAQSDADAEVTLINETEGRYGDNLMFDTSALDNEEVFAEQDVIEKEVSTDDPVTTAGEVVTTAVSAATSMVSTATTTVVATPTITVQPQQRAKGIAFREPVESTVTTTVPS
ncbi:hypothetical protein Tco_1257188 [Tanacetum coccineum]